MPTIDNDEWDEQMEKNEASKHMKKVLDKIASTTPSWEERFNEFNFDPILHTQTGHYIRVDQVKDFISKLLKEEREKAYERGRNSMKEKITKVIEREIKILRRYTHFTATAQIEILNDTLQALEDGKNNIK